MNVSEGAYVDDEGTIHAFIVQDPQRSSAARRAAAIGVIEKAIAQLYRRREQLINFQETSS